MQWIFCCYLSQVNANWSSNIYRAVIGFRHLVLTEDRFESYWLLRMQSSCDKDDQSTDQSLAPFFITCSSLWNSTEPKYSPSKSIITGQESSANKFFHMKQSESQFQEQDSSSTLSTCQSHYGMADAARNSTSTQNIRSQRGHICYSLSYSLIFDTC